MNRSKLSGFTLIELAVSIVIIGLLVGGIAGGSKLLSQAELRAMISQMDQFKADYNSFNKPILNKEDFKGGLFEMVNRGLIPKNAD